MTDPAKPAPAPASTAASEIPAGPLKVLYQEVLYAKAKGRREHLATLVAELIRRFTAAGDEKFRTWLLEQAGRGPIHFELELPILLPRLEAGVRARDPMVIKLAITVVNHARNRALGQALTEAAGTDLPRLYRTLRPDCEWGLECIRRHLVKSLGYQFHKPDQVLFGQQPATAAECDLIAADIDQLAELDPVSALVVTCRERLAAYRAGRQAAEAE